MRDFLIVMGLAMLPALANFLGGSLAVVSRVSVRALSLALKRPRFDAVSF